MNATPAEKTGAGPHAPLSAVSSEVAAVLRVTRLPDYAALFLQEGIDDIETLKKYSEDELKKIGVKVGLAMVCALLCNQANESVSN